MEGAGNEEIGEEVNQNGKKRYCPNGWDATQFEATG
jgi:hypothetical protein